MGDGSFPFPIQVKVRGWLDFKKQQKWILRLQALDNKRDITALSGARDRPVWSDFIAFSWREPVAENIGVKTVKVSLDSVTVIIQSSGVVHDVRGVATTTKTENYRKYQ